MSLSYSNRKTLKKYSDLIESKTWTKQQIHGFSKLVNSAKRQWIKDLEYRTAVLLMWSKFCNQETASYAITKQQSKFGISWLKELCFKKNGEPRDSQKMVDFGGREFRIINDFSHFTFVGYHCEFHNYLRSFEIVSPVYCVHSTSGDCFEYSVPGMWGTPVLDQFLQLNEVR